MHRSFNGAPSRAQRMLRRIVRIFEGSIASRHTPSVRSKNNTGADKTGAHSQLAKSDGRDGSECAGWRAPREQDHTPGGSAGRTRGAAGCRRRRWPSPRHHLADASRGVHRAARSTRRRPRLPGTTVAVAPPMPPCVPAGGRSSHALGVGDVTNDVTIAHQIAYERPVTDELHPQPPPLPMHGRRPTCCC